MELKDYDGTIRIFDTQEVLNNAFITIYQNLLFRRKIKLKAKKVIEVNGEQRLVFQEYFIKIFRRNIYGVRLTFPDGVNGKYCPLNIDAIKGDTLTTYIECKLSKREKKYESYSSWPT